MLGKLRLYKMTIAFACGLVVIPAAGFAAGIAAPGEFTGCLRDGLLRKVALGGEPLRPCSSEALEVTWNAQGPTGPVGPQGPAGPMGPPGPPGGSGATATEVQLDLPFSSPQLNSGSYCYKEWVTQAFSPPCPDGDPTFDVPIPGYDNATARLVNPGDYPAGATYTLRFLIYQGTGSDPSVGTLCGRLFDVTADAPVTGSQTCNTAGRSATSASVTGLTLNPGTHAYVMQSRLESGSGGLQATLIIDW